MAVAIIAKASSARRLRLVGGPPGRGGARNWADRTSDGLSARQALGVLAAADWAILRGVPLNRHVTLHMSLAHVADGHAAAVVGRFLRLIRDWLRKRGERTAWTWVRENSGDEKGSHAHILIHVPANAPWTGWRVRRWFERASGKRYRRRVICTRRIGGRRNTETILPEVYRANLRAVVGYLLKGADDDAATTLQLTRRAFGGTVIGKRVGWSENVGAASRRKQTF